jgi:membrane protease YdiL (CAAX protease family)
MMAVGYVQCWLVRRTARLGPAIAVHGLLNLVALTVSVAAAR